MHPKESESPISRREFLGRVGKLFVAASGVSMLHISIAHAEQSVNCPVYLFHGGISSLGSVVRRSAAEGRLPVTMARLGTIIRGDEESPDQPLVCFTFDDGYLVQYQQAAPLLESYGATATFFVMGTGWQGDGVHAYMRPSQIQDLAQRDFEIGSHTINHDKNLINLRARNRGAYLAEIFESQTQLQELLDCEIESFCYPSGINDAAMREDVKKAYKQAASVNSGNYQTPEGLYVIRRTRMS